jgi:hypothetical protein
MKAGQELHIIAWDKLDQTDHAPVRSCKACAATNSEIETKIAAASKWHTLHPGVTSQNALRWEGIELLPAFERSQASRRR